MRRSLPFVVAALAAALLSVAGCGDDDTATDMPMDEMPMGDDGGPMGSGPMGGHEDDHEDDSPVADGARRVEVVARSFAFEPDEIPVQAGEDVAIVLTSEDILHDFTIDELDAHVSVAGGETAEGGLRAEEPGRYLFYCTVPGHQAAGMEGTLVVE